MYPALASQFVLLMLATSVVSQISAQDLFHTASIIQSRTFRDFEVYIRGRRASISRWRWSSACCSPASTSCVFARAMIREFAFIDVLYLVAAMRWTLALTAIAFVGGGLVGLVDRAAARLRACAPLRWLGTVYVLVVQGTPLLAWLFVFFFGLSIFGIEVSPGSPPPPSYSIYAGAFLGEIWRGCLQAIPTHAVGGRRLARPRRSASSCATSSCRRRSRLAIPPTVGFLVQLIKNTSLAAVIGFVELTREGQLTTATHLPPLHRLSHRGRALLRALLPADAGEPPARAEAPCRSLNSRT